MSKLKLLKAIFILPALLCMSGCKDPSANYGETGGIMLANSNLETICVHSHGNRVTYYRDVDTDIMYIFYSYEKSAGISVYYNTEGQPMSWTEFQQVHTAKYHK